MLEKQFQQGIIKENENKESKNTPLRPGRISDIGTIRQSDRGECNPKTNAGTWDEST